MCECGSQGSSIAADAAIRPNASQSRTPLFDQSQPNVSIRGAFFRGTINCTHELVVHEWGPDCQLALLKCQDSVVVPRRLPKSSECHRMLLAKTFIRGPCGI